MPVKKINTNKSSVKKVGRPKKNDAKKTVLKSVAKKPKVKKSTAKKKAVKRRVVAKKKPIKKKIKTNVDEFNFDDINDMDLDFAFDDSAIEEALEPIQITEQPVMQKVTVLHSARFTFYLGMLLGMLLLSASLIFSFAIAMYQTSDSYIAQVVEHDFTFDLLGLK